MKFSIIIVNFNGRNYLSNCLKSILKNNFPDFEIIIADNHSGDNSVNFIKKKFSGHLGKIKIIELKDNFGPAFARNQAVKQSKGEILAFLDNDTEVDKNWLTAANKEFLKDKRLGCIQAKLLLLNEKNKFDYAGDYLNQFGLLSHRATYKDIDVSQFNQKAIIFAAKSAGMFIRKSTFKKIGGFDNDYFIYMEETDLCWRSWLLGYKTIYLPSSIVYHGFSGSFKILNNNLAVYNLRFHGTKNYILTNLKNLSAAQLLIILPQLISIYVLYSFYILFFKRQPKDFCFMISGIFWNLFHLNQTLTKRRLIQGSRKLSDRQLFPYIFKKTTILDKIKKSIFLNTNA